MTLKKYNSAYENQTKTIIKSIFISTFILLLIFIISITLIDVNSVSNLEIIRDLNGINFIVGLMSIPICYIYYYIYKNNEFFIITLSFFSILIEYTYMYFVLEHLELKWILVTFPFLFRIFLLIIAIYNKSSLANLILNNKFIAIISVIILNIVGTHFEIILKVNVLNYSPIVFDIINIIIITYYYTLLIRLSIRCIKKNEFIYSILISSISLFTIRRIFYLSIFGYQYPKIREYNKWISFISYLILLSGLFIEIIRKKHESDMLNSEIDDNKNIISTISKQYNEIKEVEIIRNQFFANLSHEFKTPINIIYSCVQLLDVKKGEGQLELVEAYCKYDKTIKQNCFRMIRLINNLVDITKIDSGFMNLSFINYEVVSLVENITLSIIPYVESKSINVIFDTYIEELEIKCDPDMIERILLNLLSNSVKFTSNGGHILVLMSADSHWLTIRVKDDGVGIKSELKDIIFERFVQVDKSLNRKKEGSGIGLSLVKSLLELHGGNIYLEDGIERGCEFVIKLPNVRLEESDIVENNLTAVQNDTIITDNKRIVEKIQLEFSDIYELF